MEGVLIDNDEVGFDDEQNAPTMEPEQTPKQPPTEAKVEENMHTIQMDDALFWVLRARKDKMAQQKKERISWPRYLREAIPGVKEELDNE